MEAHSADYHETGYDGDGVADLSGKRRRVVELVMDNLGTQDQISRGTMSMSGLTSPGQRLGTRTI